MGSSAGPACCSLMVSARAGDFDIACSDGALSGHANCPA
jgi:hypothetical protein